MLYRLTYSSLATSEFNTDDIMYLTEQARCNNAAHNVTGLLLWYRRSFFQILEGEQGNLTQLYRLIEQDKRHTNVVLLENKPVEVRLFNQWSLGIANFPDEKPLFSPEEFLIKNGQLSGDSTFIESIIRSFTQGINQTYVQ